jgi:hypothetical protein
MEYLFRGLTKGNEWIYGDLVHSTVNCFSHIIEVGIKQDKVYPIEVLPETVGMWTGLTDKKKIKAFDGDIIFNGTMGKFVITPLEGGSFGIKGLEGKHKDSEYTISALITEFEVIGNIHQEERDGKE